MESDEKLKEPSDKEVMEDTLRVTIPAVAEWMFQGLVTMIDTMMVGVLGPGAIAAVGLTTQPKFIGLALFVSFNTAVSSVIARRYGERDRDDANNILLNGFILMLIATGAVTYIFVDHSLDIMILMKGDRETSLLASEYLKIIMGGLIFQTGTLFINACQRGIGNTKITFRTNAVSNVLNAFLNFLLIEGRWGFPRMEVRGAAIATVIGSAAGFILALSSILRSDAFLSIFHTPNHIGLSKRTVSSLGKIGLSTLAEQACMRFGFLAFALTVSSLGTNRFAANQIGMNISQISYSFGEGISCAALALVGRSMGERDLPLAKRYISCLLKISRRASVVTAAIFIFLGKYLFLLFTDEPQVLIYSVYITCILGITSVFQIPAYVYAGSLRGAGDAAFIAVTSLICVGLIRSLASYLLTYPMGLGLYGAWLGYMADQTMRFFFNYGRFKTGKWEKIKL